MIVAHVRKLGEPGPPNEDQPLPLPPKYKQGLEAIKRSLSQDPGSVDVGGMGSMDVGGCG